jgi:hypothetical protein
MEGQIEEMMECRSKETMEGQIKEMRHPSEGS